ncbi:MAG: 50S ribosomal protein L23 [Candidatus Andersenbacteria bacterium]|nr:50S ribosomal protein L23 [Candidatus Andersenbacteria bacterium]
MSILSQAKKILKRDEAAKEVKGKTRTKKANPEAKEAPKKTSTMNLVAAGTIGLSVVLSEKSIAQQAGNVLVVKVKPAATKSQIAGAVQSLFGVKVLAVRTTKVYPKRRQRGITAGRTKHMKKAYVKVDDISKINVAP